MAIIKNHRLEYEVGQIDVTYPKNDKETYFGSVPVIVPNNWTPPKPPPQPGKMPVKGDLISIDKKQYRVLKIDNTIAEVVAMYNSTESQTFGTNNIYPGSGLDDYCNDTFLRTLPEAMQNAIVAKTFKQDRWITGNMSSALAKYQGKYGTENYIMSLLSDSYSDSISRNCYVLSIQDIIDYLEVTTAMTSADTTLTDENMWKMFWNQTDRPGSGATYVLWLASATNAEAYGYTLGAYSGSFSTPETSKKYSIRPAFQIDLSKIDFKEV